MTADTRSPREMAVEALKLYAFIGDWRRAREALAALQSEALEGDTFPAAVLWRVKDFADGWIYFDSSKEAYEEVDATGALIQPLFLEPPPVDRNAVLVPREPTEEMLEPFRGTLHRGDWREYIAGIYRSMIAHRPPSPSPVDDPAIRKPEDSQ